MKKIHYAQSFVVLVTSSLFTISIVYLNKIVFIILVTVFLCAAVIQILLYKKDKTFEKSEYDKKAIEIEMIRAERAPESKPHCFVNGICKYCGNSIGAAHYFGWYECNPTQEK